MIQIGASIDNSACAVQGETHSEYSIWIIANRDSPSSVQASFGFNFGALPSKQSSLPPQRSSRQTPVRGTPRSSNGSAKRYRSASVQRSGSAKPRATPKDQTITPQIGKRKRGSANTQAGEDEEEADELSPDRIDEVPSVEKSRRIVGTVSPIREENDDLQDELSILGDEGSATQKPLANGSHTNGTPVSAIARNRQSSGTARARTPIADRISAMTMSSRRSVSRRSKSTEPNTPSLLSSSHPRISSASRFAPAFDTPGAAPAGTESEDELSPPQMNSTTPRVVGTAEPMIDRTQDGTEMHLDELSSPVQQSTIVETPKPATTTTPAHSINKKTTQPKSAKHGQSRRRRIIEDDVDVETTTPARAEPPKRGRPPKDSAAAKSKTLETSIMKTKAKSARKNIGTSVDEKGLEASEPAREKPLNAGGEAANESRTEVEISEDEASDEYEEVEIEEQEPESRVPAKRRSPKQAKPTSEGPPRKRHKFLGPKQAISVMRLKGSAVRGITVADTTRQIIGDTIDTYLGRKAEKLQTCKDSAQRKELRSGINIGLSFKESLEEKMLDVQDANDVLSLNMKKMKLFRRDNAELRKEILTLQNSRQEIAVEHDDIQMDYEAEKAKVDARNKLSADIFDIEAAIQSGKERARRLGREDEGPEIPLPMLLDMVGRDVSSRGGGLLTNITKFNGILERAAGWLEGRV